MLSGHLEGTAAGPAASCAQHGRGLNEGLLLGSEEKKESLANFPSKLCEETLCPLTPFDENREEELYGRETEVHAPFFRGNGPEGTWVQSLIWEDPTRHGPTKPIATTEPVPWSLGTATAEPTCHNRRRPSALEPVLCNERKHRSEKPAHRSQRKPVGNKGQHRPLQERDKPQFYH
ncbi:hypothetical protein MJT46_008305 [Ovis ammon polii x Ovis aries]|nr:hypothetical protein MJT46_008305 [Ovis ammon polii x Ovis aries]